MVLIPGLLAIIVFGWLLITVIGKDFHWVSKFGLAYLVGMGIFTWVWFIFNWGGVAYSATSGWLILLCLSLVALLGVLITGGWQRLVPKAEINRTLSGFKQWGKWEKICLVAIMIMATLAIISSLYWPVKDWDSLVLYDFRAKTFVATGGMSDGISRGYFFGYPLMISLGHTWVYFLDYPYPGIVHSLMYTSWLLICYSLIRQWSSRQWALVWTLVSAFTPELFGPAHMTYTNLAYTVYLVSGFLYLAQWSENKKWSWLVLGSLLLALGGWVRSSEPFWLLALLTVIVVSIWRKKWLAWVVVLGLVYGVAWPWTQFERIHSNSVKTHLENVGLYATLLSEGFQAREIYEVSVYYYQHVLKPVWPSVILIFGSSYLMARRWRVTTSQSWVVWWYIVGAFGMTWLGIYLFSIFYEDWRNIGGSAQRMTIFLVPLVQYLVAKLSWKITQELKLWPQRKVAQRH